MSHCPGLQSPGVAVRAYQAAGDLQVVVGFTPSASL